MDKKLLTRISIIIHLLLTITVIVIGVLFAASEIPPDEYGITFLLMLPIIIGLVLGIGALLFKNWARVGMFIYSIIGVILGIWMLIGSIWASGAMGANLIGGSFTYLISFILYGYLFLLLRKEDVKVLFS